MRNLILFLTMLIPLFSFAGEERLNDGKTVVYWDDCTTTIRYNSYRVYINLTDTYEKNVWGYVELIGCNETVPKNFMIRAGERNTYVDFDDLSNDITYRIKVTVKGK